jgi:hypothetical protein
MAEYGERQLLVDSKDLHEIAWHEPPAEYRDGLQQ